MTMGNRICIVAEDYPSKGNPSFPFVQQLAYSLSNEGIDCTIIAPQSFSKALIRHEKLRSVRSTDVSPDMKKITVYRPYVITFSNTNIKWLSSLSSFLYENAIKRVLKRIKQLDTVYCYFWHMGLITAKVLKNRNVQLVVQASECSISVNDSYNKPEYVKRVDGVVCASKKNYEESLEYGLINENSRTVIIPNGFRKDEFYSIDKTKARNELGYNEAIFIVAFVGDFNERKGSQRLSKAIDRFDDVYSVFIGKGNKLPSCKNILFQGLVEHNKLCLYLNCADIFVLPTNAEGCCNAIIEAIACGLPVVSSNRSFNNEILDESYSIKIDESSIDDITEAIRKLKDNTELRRLMSENALNASKKFLITRRAKAIVDFLFSKDI